MTRQTGGAAVVSLAEWRRARLRAAAPPAEVPAEVAPVPHLRLVRAGERPPAFTLERFLARARVVMAEARPPASVAEPTPLMRARTPVALR